jgi:aldose sugar dehydrogenase
VTVQGTEHFAWNQQADSLDDIRQYAFVAYVDDAPQALPDAACASSGDSTSVQFDCSARLPPMSPGAHRLQIAAAREVNGVSLEGPRSDPLNVLVMPAASGNASASGDSRLAVTAADGTMFTVETLASGLAAPAGLAPAPDGRVFIAERSGDVQVWKHGQILDTPALRIDDAVVGSEVGLIGIAVDPDFAQNGQVFLAYAARSADGGIVNRIVRFREVNDIFGEAAVILEDIATSAPQRTPRIGFGPDKKLYVAFPVDASARQDPASYGGKILRLNDDGTTPRDNARSSPILSDGQEVPFAFAWQPATAQLWQVDRDRNHREILTRLGAASARVAAAVYVDPASDPSGAAFYVASAIPAFTGNLFVSALDGQRLQRVRFDPANHVQVVATESLLDRAFGRISDIAAGADGALYFCTSNRGGSGPADAKDDRLARIVPFRDKDDAGRKGK